MAESSEPENITKQVKDNLDLSASQILQLLKLRVRLSAFQLAVMAEVDTGAFNKIMNGQEGRLLHHDEINRLIYGLVGDGRFMPEHVENESSLWLMALQSAAAADAQMALAGRFNRTATANERQYMRRTLVSALRQIWLGSNGAVPALDSPKLRISLCWQAAPKDLDLHLQIVGANDVYAVWYRNRGSLRVAPFAELDNDVTTGYGPETIETSHFIRGIYRGAVHNLSGESPLAGCGATVIIRMSFREFIVECPSEGIGRWWSLFELDSADGKLKVINQIVESPW